MSGIVQTPINIRGYSLFIHDSYLSEARSMLFSRMESIDFLPRPGNRPVHIRNLTAASLDATDIYRPDIYMPPLRNPDFPYFTELCKLFLLAGHLFILL